MRSYAVLDLEMCKVPKANRTMEYPWVNEIIQIGAVLLDESYQVVDQFSSYVSPEYGILDSYIERWTGISKQNLDDAPYLQETLHEFEEWLPDDVSLVAWFTSQSTSGKYWYRVLIHQRMRFGKLWKNLNSSNLMQLFKPHMVFLY